MGSWYVVMLYCVLMLACVSFLCPAYQVYRGKWCNIDIAAKEYLAVDDGESEQFNADHEPTEAARNRAKVSYTAAAASHTMLWYLAYLQGVVGHMGHTSQHCHAHRVLGYVSAAYQLVIWQCVWLHAC